MFISPAYAQTTAPNGSAFDFTMLLPLVAMFAIMYFLIIRPQQTRLKQHREMVSNVRRGDTVVTAGGLIGKVTRVVDDTELQVELADNVRVRVVKGTLSEVRAKGEPAKDEK